jgi:hypothetical protein
MARKFNPSSCEFYLKGFPFTSNSSTTGTTSRIRETGRSRGTAVVPRTAGRIPGGTTGRIQYRRRRAADKHSYAVFANTTYTFRAGEAIG